MSKNNYLAVMFALVSTILLSACTHPQQAVKENPLAVIVGADRDVHGCIGSAGYSWCSKENSCVRSWELAAQKGFASSAEAFNHYCSS